MTTPADTAASAAAINASFHPEVVPAVPRRPIQPLPGGTIAAPQGTDTWLPQSVRIAGLTDDTADTRTYELEFVDSAVGAEYTFQPGQFNMLYLPGAGEAAISISGRPRRGAPLLHTVRSVGNVTRGLARLRVGDRFGLRGPFGAGWPIEAARRQQIVFVAGGIGLAPLRPAIYAAIDSRDEFSGATLLYGGRTPQDLLYPGEFDDWRRQGLDVQTTVDRSSPGWTGAVGVVTLLLERLELPDPRRTILFICGPEIMMAYAARAALLRNIPAANLWVSLERNMNCAVGFCGHCQLGPEFLCKDGPVLRYDRVAPLLHVEGL